MYARYFILLFLFFYFPFFDQWIYESYMWNVKKSCGWFFSLFFPNRSCSFMDPIVWGKWAFLMGFWTFKKMKMDSKENENNGWTKISRQIFLKGGSIVTFQFFINFIFLRKKIVGCVCVRFDVGWISWNVLWVWDYWSVQVKFHVFVLLLVNFFLHELSL